MKGEELNKKAVFRSAIGTPRSRLEFSSEHHLEFILMPRQVIEPPNSSP